MIGIEVHRRKATVWMPFFFGRKTFENRNGKPHGSLWQSRQQPDAALANYFHLMGSESYKCGGRHRSSAVFLPENISTNDRGNVLGLS